MSLVVLRLSRAAVECAVSYCVTATGADAACGVGERTAEPLGGVLGTSIRRIGEAVDKDAAGCGVPGWVAEDHAAVACTEPRRTGPVVNVSISGEIKLSVSRNACEVSPLWIAGCYYLFDAVAGEIQGAIEPCP